MGTEPRGLRSDRRIVGCFVVASVVPALIFVTVLIRGLQATRDEQVESDSHIDGNAEASRFDGGCMSNLKEIGIALLVYHDTHGVFPPASIPDANGRPMHSWRVLLLPHFVDPSLHNLYQQYDFNEPWNGPNNGRLADKMPVVYRCPAVTELTDETSYVAIVGPETGWPAPDALTIHKIAHGASNSIAVIEIADSDIHWMEPRDLPFDDALAGFNLPHLQFRGSNPHGHGANFLFWNGGVSFLRNDTTPERLRALLTAGGGEDDWPD